MAGRTRISQLLPATPRQRPISLTPLVDVIFLLLIFFMLTSQTVPFSLIPLANINAGGTTAQPAKSTAPTATIKGNYKLLITVLRGGIRIDGKSHPFGKIDDALLSVRQRGIDAAIISPRSDANVQDLISVLEAVKKAKFKSVTIRKSGR